MIILGLYLSALKLLFCLDPISRNFEYLWIILCMMSTVFLMSNLIPGLSGQETNLDEESRLLLEKDGLGTAREASQEESQFRWVMR